MSRAPQTVLAADPMTTAFRWLAFAVLATQIVFAHGCHGDADHELFTRISVTLHWVVEPARP